MIMRDKNKKGSIKIIFQNIEKNVLESQTPLFALKSHYIGIGNKMQLICQLSKDKVSSFLKSAALEQNSGLFFYL